MNDKPLPNNKSVEMALIADIFKKNDIMADCIGKLKPNDFYYKPHENIYSKLMDLYKKSISIDLITFTNNINKETLKGVGGITYLSEIIASEAITSNFKQYLNIIKELSVKRELIKACQNALSEVYSEEIEAKSVIDTLETKLMNTGDTEENKTINLEKLMQDSISLIEDGYKSGGKITGITTGYRRMDNAINGFMKGDLVVIAARPSMGKTALVMNILNNFPIENKAALFEMEMSQGKLGIRMLAPKTLINSNDLSRGQIKDEYFNLILQKANEISLKNNVYINCKAGLSVSEIKAECKKIKIQNDLQLIFIDHIGKIKPDNLKDTKNNQIGQISEGLKNMAKDLDICVVVLSQLNRAVEARQDKRPMLSDLRDSGNIEQDADAILMLYREDYYAERENTQSKTPGVLEIMVAKNRDGQAGLIKLFYNTKYQIITEKPLLEELCS